MARILVLNDAQAMLDVDEAALTELGHEVVTRSIVRSGPETVRDVTAEALVVDLQRPGDDHYGLRMIQEIRAEPGMRTFPIILCTGASVELVQHVPWLTSLSVPVLRKPFDIGELGATLDGVMGKAAVDS